MRAGVSPSKLAYAGCPLAIITGDLGNDLNNCKVIKITEKLKNVF